MDEWNTPKWLKLHFKDHFDPCPENYKEDGLEIGWKTPCFVNPPYSKPLLWIKKGINESKKGVDIVFLLRVDVSTEYYKLLIENNAHFVYFNERLHFGESKNSPPFSSMLVYLEGKKINLNNS